MPHALRSRSLVAALCALVLLGLAPLAAWAGGSHRPAQSAAVEGADLSVGEAIVLGAVEGITEFLPVSSTGHLVVVERLLDLPTKGDAGKAIDSYTVVIQVGAILAVLLISWRRVVELFQGIVGKSERGRRLLLNLIAAFLPAAVLGLAFNNFIDDHLLAPLPVAAAWFVGGIVILLLAKRLRPTAQGRDLDSMTVRHALIIGGAQAISLFPGTSRSLVTIVAGVLIGLSLGAAVEFSFLLGLATLTAASAYKLLKDHTLIVDTFGTGTPLLGIAVAAICAWLAVKTFVQFLKTRSLDGFGWYRIAAAVVTVVLVATSVIER